MPSQLIYTSAPQGLAAGQSGYCTVARDAELREALARALEQLSSYNHAASGGQPSPVVSAYRILDLRGAKYHVLSRIQDAGLDFTNRTNHLAHHLVFEPHELANLPSPALIFRDWNGWRKEWKEPPRLLGQADWGNLAQLPRAIALPAKHWANLTGDAGSAAGLLEREFASGGFLLADSAEVFLPLFAESVQLLALQGKAQAEMWQYAFTTRLQPEDNPNDFRWRGCQPNSSAYQVTLRKGASFKPVNSIKAPANDLAQCARTGKSPLPGVRVPTPASSQTAPQGMRPEQRPTTPKTVQLRGWDPDPSHFESEEDGAKAQGSSQTRWLPWVSLVVFLVVGLGGWAWFKSGKQQSGEKVQIDKQGSTISQVAGGSNPPSPPGTNGTNPVPPRTAPSPLPYSNDDEKLVARLPDFTTYLVSLPSDNSGISVDTISSLSNVCAQLKSESDVPSIDKIMKCRVRRDALLWTEEPNSVVSFELNNGNGNLSGEGFSFEAWKIFMPPQNGLTVIDFDSPENKFGKFRIVTFPVGSTNQPLTFSKSLLRENQTTLHASFKGLLANRIDKFEAVASLQLRPFVKNSGGVKDLIDAMHPAYVSPITKGNELNFVKLQQQLSNQINKLSDQMDKQQQDINTTVSSLASLSTTIKTQEESVKKSPDDAKPRKELDDSLKIQKVSQASLNSKKKGLSDLQHRKDILANSVAMVPADLNDSKLDHVALVFVTTKENKPADRIELIRFNDSEAAK